MSTFSRKKNGKRFSHATNFNKLLQNACQEFSQTALTPHLIRKMFVNHISKYSPEIKGQITELLPQSAASYKDGADEQIDVWMRRETIKISGEFAERTAQEFLWF